MYLIEKSWGIIIEKFSDYIGEKIFRNRIIENNEHNLNQKLILSSTLTLEKITKLPLDEITKEIDKIDIRLFENCIDFIYRNNKYDTKLNNHLLILIEYLNKINPDISPQRNNLENSIHHSLKNNV